MRFSENDINRITESIWRSIAGLELVRARTIPTHDGTRPFITGCVHITGAWEGAVTVDCTIALARRVASAMFAVRAEAATESEIQDALGEMTNMTGGNIKSLLPAPSILSLPAVADGSDYRLNFPGGRKLSQVAFECDGEPLLVTLLERDEAVVSAQASGERTTAEGSRKGRS